MDLSPAAKRAFQIQSYGPAPTIEGVEIVELKRFADDGGSMTELGRLTSGHPQAFRGFEVRQINYSEVEPGAIKAFHLHQRQTDIWFVPPSDRMLVETDSPFLAPVPHRGQTCEPAFVADTATYVADLRGETPGAFAEATTANFFRLFPKAAA